MSSHRVSITWKRTTPDFNYDSYDRTHKVFFGGGSQILGSAAPEYLGNSQYANPEEMLAAALSSCHMLTFLAIAAKSRLIVDEYVDQSEAFLETGKSGKLCVTKVVLRPRVKFNTEVSSEKLDQLHKKAHENCFIANSVHCEVSVL